MRPVERPISVSVLVDLEWSSRSGGHVLCWQRIAEAAARRDEDLDLTIHVEGRARSVAAFSERVRMISHRPVLSSARLPFLRGVADYTDLAPLHPGLLKALLAADVLHTTDAHFAYSKTARLAAALTGVPLVGSLHTDTARYARIYSEEIIGALFGRGRLARALIERLRVPERLARRMDRRLKKHIARSRWTLFSERDPGAGLAREDRASVLRRGIDKALFHPRRRDRARLARLGVPADHLAALYVGRLDHVKSVMLAARAVKRLADRGRAVTAIFAGEGPCAAELRRLLGPNALLLGSVPQEELAPIYASADVFVFPSRTELSPNVVLEAKASGLPVIVAPGGGDVFVHADGADGLIVEALDPGAWAEAIDALARDPSRRARMSAAARLDVERRRPSWEEVLAEDLLPVWRRVARETRGALSRRRAHA